jgi:hypothetical protein
MMYRAHLTFDWGAPHSPNDQQAIIAALLDIGWLLVETTAFAIETQDVAKVWMGIEVVAKGSTAAGTLTALTFSVVAGDNFARSRPYPAAANHPEALDKILWRGLPRPK